MPKTWDFHLRVPSSLVAPLMELVTERDGVTVIHIGQTEDTKAPPLSASARTDKWATKIAVDTLRVLREMSREGDNGTIGVWYTAIGDELLKRGLIASAKSVSSVLSYLTRAEKIKKVGRGRYLPIVP